MEFIPFGCQKGEKMIDSIWEAFMEGEMIKVDKVRIKIKLIEAYVEDFISIIQRFEVIRCKPFQSQSMQSKICTCCSLTMCIIRNIFNCLLLLKMSGCNH